MADQDMRFGFGKNWEQFIRNNFSDERVEIAGKHILSFLSLDSLDGKYFLDIGCGSGLHSLAAVRAGAARVFSFDYDWNSVNTTMKLKKWAGNPAHWEVKQGSILDDEFLKTIAPPDIVYSWGVLHHTGDMWKAMDNTARLAGESSLLYIALYDYDFHVNPPAEYWLEVKQRYNRSSSLGKRRMELWYVWNHMCFRRRSEVPTVFLRFLNYKHSRGMAQYTDIKDWLGGWPMEFAKRADVADWAKRTGLKMLVMKTGEANTEYLFKRTHIPGERSSVISHDA